MQKQARGDSTCPAPIGPWEAQTARVGSVPPGLMAMAMDQQVFGCLVNSRSRSHTLVKLERNSSTVNTVGPRAPCMPGTRSTVVLAQVRMRLGLNTDDRYTRRGREERLILCWAYALPGLDDPFEQQVGRGFTLNQPPPQSRPLRANCVAAWPTSG